MPELPEVETVVRYLKPRITGGRICSVWVAPGCSKVIQTHTLRSFRSWVCGQRIESVDRRAKFVLLKLTRGVIGIHLRMTGHLFVAEGVGAETRHISARLDLAGGRALFFKDVRKFGRIFFWEDLSQLDSKLGIEPLSKEFSPAALSALLRQRSRMMKPLLLDQRIIAGLGNIYTDEVLWAAGIHPRQRSDTVPAVKLRKLHRAIRTILQRSIKLNGTTFATFVFGENRSGEFVRKLKVFGREGNPCRRCGSKIVKLRVGQRGTHICPRCQRCKLGGS